MFSKQLYYSHLKTKTLGTALKYFPSTDSTNKRVWEFINTTNRAEGILSITDNQLSGKGRRGNEWFSLPNSGLTFSVVIYPQLSPEKIGLISLVAGIASCEGIWKSTGIKAELKWPNDIVYNKSKLGGILAECRKIGNKNVVVLGIGINVNETLKDFPAYLQHSAISVRQITKLKVQREILLAEICNSLESVMRDETLIVEKWKTFCSHLGANIQFHQGNQLLSGRFVDLNDNGYALVEINNEIKTFSTGEIII